MRSGPSRVRAALQVYVQARADAMGAARRELGLGDGDAKALLHIAAYPGIRPTQLRDHLGITSAGITALIDRLVERGIVRRDVDPDDRRVNRISVTVDLDEDPWSQLSRFDNDFDLGVDEIEESETDTFTALLESLTSATVERGRR
ncbi:MarR family transcriptional regulator [Microbacterium sp. SSM24]|uniref:MarR family transcriptional regulator n=1 Tax=Microbacterium sp. SSM24 TaxID=2991714 RepID=UPI0022265D2E|nr:helix-turn-helix domain-containing protein [Microbacterium sp. SSM24]MCW3493207.1 MarR family transcriptional regulator [Microbacterium sp. SSM24]